MYYESEKLEITAAGIYSDRWAVFGFNSGAVIARNLDGEFLFVWGPHTGEICHVAFQDENRVVIATSWTVHVHGKTGQTLGSFKIYGQSIQALACSGKHVAAGTSGSLYVWRSASRYSLNNFAYLETEEITALALADQTLVVGYQNGAVHLFRIEDVNYHEPPRLLPVGTLDTQGIRGSTKVVAAAISQEKIATAFRNGLLLLWDREGNRLTGWQHREGYWNGLAFSPLGHLIAYDRRSLHYWKLNACSPPAVYIPDKEIVAADFVADSPWKVAIAFRDTTMQIWHP